MDKATIRAELEAAVAEFVAAGGVIEQIKARKNPRLVVRGKAAKGTSFNALMEKEFRTSKITTAGQINEHTKRPAGLVDVFV